MQLDLLPPAETLKTDISEKHDPSLPDDGKAPGAFKTIGEAADTLGVPQHVLRFWEDHFPQIKPLKMRGGRRYYRPQDMDILSTVKHLLYKQGYTIKGAKKALNASRKTTSPATEPTPPKQALTSKQHHQLSMLRMELIHLRDALRPYLA